MIKGSVLYGMCFKKKKKKVSKFVCLTSIDSRLTRTCEGVGRPPKTDSQYIERVQILQALSDSKPPVSAFWQQ